MMVCWTVAFHRGDVVFNCCSLWMSYVELLQYTHGQCVVLNCCSLPADVLFLEEPQVARWDVNKQYWRTDGFSNFVFDEGQLVCPDDATHTLTLPLQSGNTSCLFKC